MMETSDEERFQHLWVHRTDLVRRLTMILRDPSCAEDVAQVAIMRAHAAWPPDGVANVRAWLFTIGTRLALNETRRRNLWGFLPLTQADRAVSSSTDPDLWHALGTLDRVDRAIVIMHVLEGYGHQEIADQLGLPVGTVSSKLSRSKAKLRELLGDRR